MEVTFPGGYCLSQHKIKSSNQIEYNFNQRTTGNTANISVHQQMIRFVVCCRRRDINMCSYTSYTIVFCSNFLSNTNMKRKLSYRIKYYVIINQSNKLIWKCKEASPKNQQPWATKKTDEMFLGCHYIWTCSILFNKVFVIWFRTGVTEEHRAPF